MNSAQPIFEDRTVIPTILIDGPAFAAAMAIACRIADKHNPVPALQCVMVRGTDAGITISATDLEQLVAITLPCQGAAGVEILLPAFETKAALAGMKRGVIVSLRADAAEPWIMVGGMTTRLNGKVRNGHDKILSSDWRKVDTTDEGAHFRPRPVRARFTMDATDMLRQLRAVAHAISTEETRYYLNGVYLEAVLSDAGNMLRAVTTDGHRLSMYDLPLPLGAGELIATKPADYDSGVIVPRAMAIELAKLLSAKGAPASVAVEITTATISITVGNVVLSSKLIDGTFPAYTKVIPTGAYPIRFDRAELAGALDALIRAGQRKSAGIAFDFDEAGVTMSRRDPDAGTAAEARVACTGAPFPFRIGFNGLYLSEAIAEMGDTSVTISLSGTVAVAGGPTIPDMGAPVLITGDNAAWTQVLMPMRT